MNTIYFNAKTNDDIRRNKLYSGKIFVYSPCPSAIALCQLARDLIEAAFGSPLPPKIEEGLAVEDFLVAESSLKQQLMHHPQVKQLIRSLLQEFGCSLSKTYFDLPQLRIFPCRGYLPNGEGMFHDPHRDTWYAAPQCLINWWIPLCDFESENALAFHPLYWNRPAQNDSAQFNQGQDYKINFREAEFPHPTEEVVIEPEVRVVCPAFSPLLFSGAQMHSAVPNTSGLTRYSLDLRTVHYDDIVAGHGAPNVDSQSANALLSAFMRAEDFTFFPDQSVEALLSP